MWTIDTDSDTDFFWEFYLQQIEDFNQSEDDWEYLQHSKYFMATLFDNS